MWCFIKVVHNRIFSHLHIQQQPWNLRTVIVDNFDMKTVEKRLQLDRLKKRDERR